MERESITGVKQRGIVFAIIMSIFFPGIYSMYWKCSLVNNTRAISDSTKSRFWEKVFLLFFPIYPLYWWFTRGELVKNELTDRGYKPSCSGAAFLIFAIFGLNIYPMIIMQNDFNKLYISDENKGIRRKAEKRIIVTTIIVTVLSIITIVLWLFLIHPLLKYTVALNKWNNNDYCPDYKAYKIFKNLDGFINSEKYVKEYEDFEYAEGLIDYPYDWDVEWETLDNYDKAIEMLETFGKYSLSEELIFYAKERKEEFKDYNFSVRCHLYFGNIENDNGETDTITWQVLKRNDNHILIFSTDTIAVMPFNENNDFGKGWETSSVREYLNSDTFINKTFSKEEQERILTKEIISFDNYNNAYSTKDKLFLLSLEEVDEYDIKDICEHDTWLRSPSKSMNATTAAIISTRYSSNYLYNVKEYEVRPAMWITIE